jgi:hypothetical protein
VPASYDSKSSTSSGASLLSVCAVAALCIPQGTSSTTTASPITRTKCHPDPDHPSPEASAEIKPLIMSENSLMNIQALGSLRMNSFFFG